jgi:hypothetical protein
MLVKCVTSHHRSDIIKTVESNSGVIISRMLIVNKFYNALAFFKRQVTVVAVQLLRIYQLMLVKNSR